MCSTIYIYTTYNRYWHTTMYVYTYLEDLDHGRAHGLLMFCLVWTSHELWFMFVVTVRVVAYVCCYCMVSLCMIVVTVCLVYVVVTVWLMLACWLVVCLLLCWYLCSIHGHLTSLLLLQVWDVFWFVLLWGDLLVKGNHVNNKHIHWVVCCLVIMYCEPAS